MYLRKIFLLSLSSLCLYANELDEAFSLSLEELLNVKVSVASKEKESIVDAPGSISFYDSKAIEQTGYYTLADLADITPGYSTYTIFGEKVFETRGQKAGSFNNNKHLLLIDGIPIHHARNYKVQTENELPLYFASSVEFLRGPASVLYGTGAFYGVINIDPKVSNELGTKVETKVSAGSLDEQKRVMANMMHTSVRSESLLSVGYYDKEASKDQVGLVPDSSNLYRDNQESNFLFLKHKVSLGTLEGLGFGLLYTQKKGGLGEAYFGGGTSQSNALTWTSFIPYIKYEKELAGNWISSSYIKYNESVENGLTVPRQSLPVPVATIIQSEYKSKTRDYEIQSELHKTIDDKRSIHLGLNYDRRQELGGPDSYVTLVSNDPLNPVSEFGFNESDWFNTYSAYGQYKHELDILSGLLITAGLRFDYAKAGASQSYDNFAPRISLVQRISDSFNLKLLYGSALRAPGIKEVGLNAEAEASTPGVTPSSLNPEKFETYELGAVYYTKGFSFESTFFYNETKDALDGVQRSGENIFENSSGVIEAYGTEMELRYQLLESLEINMNYAYSRAKDAQGTLLSDVPRQKVNLIINHLLEGSIPVNNNLIIRYVDEYRNGSAEAYKGQSIIDWNLMANLSKALSLEFQARNLLDKSYYVPKSGIADIPMPGRSFLGTLSLRF